MPKLLTYFDLEDIEQKHGGLKPNIDGSIFPPVY